MNANKPQAMTSFILSVMIVFIYLVGDCSARPGYSSSVNSIENSGDSGCSPLANLCNSTVDYPYEEIRMALKRFPEYQSYFGMVMSFPKTRDRRQLDGNVEDDICQMESSKMYPRVGINIENERITIVNTDDVKQKVSYVKCLNERCRPIESLIELLALNEDGNLIRSKFSIPFTCRMRSVVS
ncbi:hypothetical protein Trydic_g8518 [Trypoxylus dichotomus]